VSPFQVLLKLGGFGPASFVKIDPAGEKELKRDGKDPSRKRREAEVFPI